MTTIIYHEIKPGIACPDGIAAAWVARQKYPDAKLIGCTYGDVPEFDLDDRTVIVDFSFSIDVLNDWAAISEVVVIDHHKTAMADLSGFSGAVFDMEESGATLAWKTFFPDRPMPAWLRYVRDRDLWNFELQGSEEIHEAAAFMGRSLRQIDFYCSLSEQELQELLIPIGTKLLQPKRKRVQEIALTACAAEKFGHNVAIVEIPADEARLTSDVCSLIYRDILPDQDFVMAYYWDEKNQEFNLSFRSFKYGNDFDVSAIARSIGGGGHRNAAGAKCKSMDFKP